MNTSLLYPLSGETVFQSGTTGVTYSVTNTGIVYLCGRFAPKNGLSNTISITLNTRTIAFNRLEYTGDNSSNTFELGLVVNLLSPSLLLQNGLGTSTTSSDVIFNSAPTPTAATDRNQGPYLPVKSGDSFTFTAGADNSIIASFYYFD